MRFDLSDLARLDGFAEALARLFWVLLAVAFLAAILGSAGTGLLVLILGAAAFVVRAGLEDFVRARRDEICCLIHACEATARGSDAAGPTASGARGDQLRARDERIRRGAGLLGGRRRTADVQRRHAIPEHHQPADPEVYPFRVEVGPRQSLKQISETEIDVVYEDGEAGVSIVAQTAYDAAGTQVPTTVDITGPESIEQVVHHREGPYVYPVIAGPKPYIGESFFFSTLISEGPNTAAPVTTPVPPGCEVPKLAGLSRREAARTLRAAHCSLGVVHLGKGADANGKVAKQFRTAGSELAAGAPVAIKLGRR